MIWVIFRIVFGCFISLYSKLIGWVMEGRKYVAAGGDQAFLMVIP